MNLSLFFQQHPRVAIAFSGGVDSAYLLYVAKNCGADVKAYYVKTAFQPQFELDDAIRLVGELGAEMEIIHCDILCEEKVTANPADRCYHCKQKLFSLLTERAKADGYTLVLDGTNASDDVGDRPGMRAIRELSVRSPLRECGLTKAEVRRLSKEAGLFTWDKPAYACLATRIPTGEMITTEKLWKTEVAENYLSGLGLSDFRVRMMGDTAKLQVKAADLPLVLEKRNLLVAELKRYYDAVLLDLDVRDGR